MAQKTKELLDQVRYAVGLKLYFIERNNLA
jgi:hypothetical protein